MSNLRLVLVTRRFWPQVGGAEIVMSNLACEFARQSHSVRIVTAQWEPHWPTELVHRDVPITRLPNPRARGWGTFRYMRSLSRWLREQAGEFDLVYVSMLKHDAYTAIGSLEQAPVVLRGEGAGVTGDCQWHEQARFGRRIRRRCREADAVIAPSKAIEQELLNSGFATNSVEYIPNGVQVPKARSPRQQTVSRRALAEVNHDLTVSDQAAVVLYTGRLDAGKGLFDLVRAFRKVLETRPTARLWLVGEGPARDELYETILDHGMKGAVLLPGAFDEVEELLDAASLFVLPSYQEGMSMSLLEAMAAGVPVVASDIEANRRLVTHEEHGLLAAPGDSNAWAAAINRQLDQEILAAAYADAARLRVAREFSLQQSASRHIDLFRRLIGQRD